MAKPETPDGEQGQEATPSAPPKGKSRKKLLLLAALVLFGLGGAGAAYTTGMTDKHASGAETTATAETGSVDLPEIIANLNAGPRRSSFVRIKARLELARKADQAVVLAAQPKIQDLFQTYLRDMRPEELRGSAGSYRLREELIARANIAVAPAGVTEILFIEMLVQ
jgi:flagellar FliL protein